MDASFRVCEVCEAFYFCRFFFVVIPVPRTAPVHSGIHTLSGLVQQRRFLWLVGRSRSLHILVTIAESCRRPRPGGTRARSADGTRQQATCMHAAEECQTI